MRVSTVIYRVKGRGNTIKAYSFKDYYSAKQCIKDLAYWFKQSDYSLEPTIIVNEVNEEIEI